MAKLEWSPIFDFNKFNFLGKRLFDFVNSKINILTNVYIGDGIFGREIRVDIIPRCIIIFSSDNQLPVIWIDSFEAPLSKQFDGVTINNGIMGLTTRKQAFILGENLLVNNNGFNYSYIVFGS